MNARKLAIVTAAVTSTLAFAAPAAQAAEPPVRAESSGLLGDLNGLLGGSVGAVLDQTGTLVAQIDPTQGVLTDLTGQVIGTVDGATGQLFDTTGQLLGTVDAATGQLLGPLGQIVGVVMPAPAGGGGSGGSGSQPAGPGSPGAPTPGSVFGSSALRLVLSASRAQRLRTVARRGVTATAQCSAACGVLAAVAVDPRTARRLGLGRGTQPAIVGTATSAAGRLPIQLSSRARRALSRALPSTRTRKKIRAKRIRAQRAYRSRSTSAAQRSRARRAYLRYRRIERRWISSGRVKLTIGAVGMDQSGRTTTIHRRSLVVKR